VSLPTQLQIGERLADERDRYRWERTPWQATQRAAWEALGRIESMKQSGLL
jgi:hypothetical protein